MHSAALYTCSRIEFTHMPSMCVSTHITLLLRTHIHNICPLEVIRFLFFQRLVLEKKNAHIHYYVYYTHVSNSC